MKFFAALIAKLTGGDASPKTLDQARSTFTEAKAALDRFGALFAAASINLDDLLASGDNALKDLVTGLTSRATTAEAALTEAKNSLQSAEAKAVAAEAKSAEAALAVTNFTALLSSIGFKPTSESIAKADAAALQAAFNTHIAHGVTAKMAELGVKAEKLPAASASDEASTEDELLAALNTATTPVEKGRIAAKLNALRDRGWGQN